MIVAANQLPSNPFGALLVAVILILISRPIIKRVAEAEGKEWLVKLMTISLVLHLLAAPGQIFVVDHFYQGIADWIRYDNQGSALAPGFRHFNFSLAPGNLRGIVNDGSVSIAAGIVFTFVGTNVLGVFLVFSWLSFLGTMLFFRAFSLTFAGANTRRYGYLIFLFPSTIFWTADVSKEAIMMLAMGLVSYGAAKLLARRRGGVSLAVVGVFISAYIRPNELFLMVAGFTVAMLVSGSGGHQGAARRLLSIIFFGGILALSIFLTFHYLHSANSTLSLQNVQQNNAGSGNSGGVDVLEQPGRVPEGHLRGPVRPPADQRPRYRPVPDRNGEPLGGGADHRLVAQPQDGAARRRHPGLRHDVPRLLPDVHVHLRRAGQPRVDHSGARLAVPLPVRLDVRPPDPQGGAAPLRLGGRPTPTSDHAGQSGGCRPSSGLCSEDAAPRCPPTPSRRCRRPPIVRGDGRTRPIGTDPRS